MRKNLLITGSAGYIGSALVCYLEQHTDHAVGGIDEYRRGNPGDTPGYKGDYAWMHVDQLAACDVIVHLAAHATVQECEAEPLPAFYNNLVHAVNLTTKLSQTVNPIREQQGLGPVELIYASTGSLYSANGVSTVYDVTKRALEDAMRQFYPRAVGLRFATVCGPSPNMRRTLLNAMVEDAMTHGVVKVQNAKARRPIADIRDLCAFVARQIDEPAPGVHDVWSYGTDIVGYAYTVARFLGDVEIEYGPDSPTYDFAMKEFPVAERQPVETIDALVQEWRARQPMPVEEGA